MEPSRRRPPSTVWQLPFTLRLALPGIMPFDMTKNDQYWLGERGGIAERKEMKMETNKLWPSFVKSHLTVYQCIETINTCFCPRIARVEMGLQLEKVEPSFSSSTVGNIVKN